MKVAAVILLLLWAISPRAASGQTSEERLERSFHAGQRALQEGNFTLAVEEFKKVLALDPTLVEAEVNLGLAYQSLFEYDLAVAHLAKALHERPNLLGPTVIVGIDYLKLGSTERAIPFLEQALKLEPSNREANEALASAYLAQENFRSAAQQFRQIASFDADKSEAFFKLGHEYLDLAARLAYRGAHRYRDSAWGHRFLGDLLFQRGRWDDALKEYEKAIIAEPQQPGLHTARGQAYLQAQKLPEAEKEFRLELQLDTRNEEAWLGLANFQLATNQRAAALGSLRKVWEISPEYLGLQREYPAFHADVAAWQQQQASIGANANQDACQAHHHSRCIDSSQIRKHLTDSERLLLGKSYFTLQQYDLAADSLAQVRGVSKENVEASYWLARTYQAQGTEAYAQLQESLPNSWRACQLRAEGAALRGDLDEATKEFHAALQLRPDEAELHEALGELYLDHHTDNAAAQSALEKALALDPLRTHALYLLGRLYVEKKDNAEALPYLQRALRLQPDLVEANSLLGTAYLRLGRVAEAIPLLEKAAPSDHYGNVHYQLYLAYRKLGRSGLAQKEMTLSQDLRRSYLERDEALIMGSPQPQPEPAMKP